MTVTAPDAPPQRTAPAETDEALPLPKWLTRVYYIFPIVLYIPDAIFNFYVYANGLIDFSNITLDKVPYIVLWAFLATGLVGMAWLLSVLAPWHWVRRNYFQSIMCWIGVVIATGITIWNSLAYRTKETNVHFPTDLWFAQTFHVDLSAWSPTTVLVAVAPPFWGLFWAIVQPAERKRSRVAEEEDFQRKLERTRQEVELKRMKAEANAQIREAQLKGFAATMRAARDQIGGAVAADTPVMVTEDPGAQPAQLPPPDVDPTRQFFTPYQGADAASDDTDPSSSGARRRREREPRTAGRPPEPSFT